jgi:DNA-directed RNA polymerase subunit M/transcription elongation factor TFIIS
MKKIRCPKCDEFISFDETKYTEGQSLVFECDHCGKQFSIRIVKKSKKKAADSPEEKAEDTTDYGSVTVLENVFGFRQEFKLKEGDNTFGRRCVGTVINQPIATSDRSIDRIHCIINVSRNKKGKIIYTLRDAPSITGTFLMNEILGDKDRIRIEDGAVITIGAATMILHGITE